MRRCPASEDISAQLLFIGWKKKDGFAITVHWPGAKTIFLGNHPLRRLSASLYEDLLTINKEVSSIRKGAPP
jgi:hypothetical protein